MTAMETVNGLPSGWRWWRPQSYGIIFAERDYPDGSTGMVTLDGEAYRWYLDNPSDFGWASSTALTLLTAVAECDDEWAGS